LRILPDAARGVKHRQPVRVHLGANQTTAQVLMSQRAVAPGDEAFAILRCESPVVAEYGQPFVVRQLSPARTIGGGTIVVPALSAADRQNRTLAIAAGLSSTHPHERLAAYIDLRREATFGEDSQSWVGLNPSECALAVNELVERGAIVLVAGPQPSFVSTHRFRELKERMIRRCQTELERRRPASFVPLSVVLSAMKRHASPQVLQALLGDMAKRGEIVVRGDRVGLSSGPELSNRQRALLTALVSEVSASGPTPPTLKEFAERQACTLKELEPIVQVAIDEGQLLRLSPQLLMDQRALEGLRQRLAEHFRNAPTAKVGEIREQWGITRKHAVPIFEFFDERQITSRDGDIRSAGPRMSIPVAEAAT
jgi:selenocysteine-specific elongation factor